MGSLHQGLGRADQRGASSVGNEHFIDLTGHVGVGKMLEVPGEQVVDVVCSTNADVQGIARLAGGDSFGEKDRVGDSFRFLGDGQDRDRCEQVESGFRGIRVTNPSPSPSAGEGNASLAVGPMAGLVSAPKFATPAIRDMTEARDLTDKVHRDAPAEDPTVGSGAPDAQAVAAKRIVIYSASMLVVVSNVQVAVDQVAALAASGGGYMQDRDDTSITIRVPAEKFDAAIARIGQLGEVTSRQVKAADITEEMVDIQIRLDTALQTRDRLLKILEKSTTTEDTLKIEAELQRLTQTIEQIKGRQRFLEQQVALSTIHVSFNSPVPQQTARAQLPFPWIYDLGDSLVTGQAEARARSESWFNRGIRFDLPKTFVRYYVDDTRTEAMSASEVLVKVQLRDNYDKGNIAFWSTLARKALVEHRAIALKETRDLKLDTGAPATLFVGTRNIAGQAQGYALLIAVNDDRVVTFEAWGPSGQFDADWAALEKAARSVRLSP